MQYRRLGRSGLKVSELSLGAWLTYGGTVQAEGAEACMREAYEAGINFFDNAEVYAEGKAELVMGEVLKKAGWRRESLVVSTKLFWGGQGPNDQGLSHKHIAEGMNASLRRLQLEYVDIVFAHRPDFKTPIEETVRAMDLLIRQGKAFYWGTSEWPADRIAMAHAFAERHGLFPPVCEQPQYHMLHRDRVEREYAPLYDSMGLGTTIWSPLASGLLTGKYNEGIPDGTRLADPQLGWLREKVLVEGNLDKARRLTTIARDLGASLSQLAIAWCLKNERVSTVITGATKVEQLRENLGATAIVPKLSSEVVWAIETILDNKPNVG
jgi:voltage-dependent potassium channel beta subunit